MARRPRIIVPGLAHHVTQRGNRREPIFFEPGDQEVYRDLLADQAAKARLTVWKYGDMIYNSDRDWCFAPLLPKPMLIAATAVLVLLGLAIVVICLSRTTDWSAAPGIGLRV